MNLSKTIHKLLVFIRKQVEQLALCARFSCYLQFGVNLIHILPDTPSDRYSFSAISRLFSRRQPDNLIFPPVAQTELPDGHLAFRRSAASPRWNDLCNGVSGFAAALSAMA